MLPWPWHGHIGNDQHSWGVTGATLHSRNLISTDLATDLIVIKGSQGEITTLVWRVASVIGNLANKVHSEWESSRNSRTI